VSLSMSYDTLTRSLFDSAHAAALKSRVISEVILSPVIICFNTVAGISADMPLRQSSPGQRTSNPAKTKNAFVSTDGRRRARNTRMVACLPLMLDAKTLYT
jgi:hypothetical protein